MANRRLAPDEIQPAIFAFTPETEAFAAAQIAKYPEGRQMSAVIPLLWQAQKQAGGWLPQKAIEAVAERLGMAYIRVLEVATFYTMFALEPVGRHFVQFCGTTPCALRGAGELKAVLQRRIGDERHVSRDGLFSWLEVECLGACCNAPMVQINDDYYEDLTPESLEKLLDDLAAGRPVKRGSQSGRNASEPQGGAKTLSDPALFDGSVVGAWRKRFEVEAVTAIGGESLLSEQRSAAEPKLAKPDAGRPIERPVADAPAQRVAKGESALNPAEQSGAAAPDRATVVEPREEEKGETAPQSAKSYVATPSKPDEDRPVAASSTTPLSGTPPSEAQARRDGSDVKPPGSEVPPEPGVAPTERK